MSTYASVQDVPNYIEGWTTTDAFALERLIRRAERDIDLIVVRLHHVLPPTQIISLPGIASGPVVFHWVDYNGATNSVTLNWPITAAQLQAALQGWTSVGANTNTGIGNVSVLGDNPFTVIWDVQWAQTHYPGIAPKVTLNIPLITVDTSGAAPAVVPTVVQEAGRKINPLTDLSETTALALSNATCAQVEYRNSMGEQFFVRPQFSSVSGPDFKTQGKLPMIAPKAKRELSQNGLIQAQGRARSGRGRRGVAAGWANY